MAKKRNPLNDPESLGEALIFEIIKQSMFTVRTLDQRGSCLILWNGNSTEQLEAVVADWLRQHPITTP